MSSKQKAAVEESPGEQSSSEVEQLPGVQSPLDATMAHGNAAMQAFVEEEQSVDEERAVEEALAKEVEIPLEVNEGAADEDKEEAGPSNDVMLAVARSGIIEEFKNIFLPSEAFQQAFQANLEECNTTLTWEEVEADVMADADAFGKGEYDDIFEDAETVTFTGRIWDLYTEASIGRDGGVQKIYFEID
jgi:hypothetical protein